MAIGDYQGNLPLKQDPVGDGPVEERATAPAAPTTHIEPAPDAHHVAPTRISASWTAIVAAVFVLIVLVIFIAENTQRSTVSFLGFHGHAPTAVVLLIAAIAGASIVIIVGVARIIQLRRVAKHTETPT